MIRKIISINEDKCNGCGICATACHEGAIEIINGKAKLIKDEYCDGLGDCLPGCPMDAITIIEREADEYNEEAVKERMKEREEKSNESLPCGCPGTMAKKIVRKVIKKVKPEEKQISNKEVVSELSQWPIQLNLINPHSEFLSDADLLIAADCTAYSYANFHRDFIKGHITMIGCPKLDDVEYYKEKLTEILRYNNVKSVKVIRMTVPCCGGIVSAVKEAMLNSGVIVPYSEVIIDTDGSII
ncbi:MULTISPECIES: ATP-binding protein [Clostridium]|uniref:ATP-binding protein n=1 Tax=Clostridium TaxID=1485 RepID=UPI0004D37DCA|nr:MULTISPECIES: 4Fe-4S binding protein [Clostridium]KEH88281.1 (Fe-S)-binding protein [Clostridium novyi A str. 4540]KEH94809.1 (Fe-S)-binding protein [Clostridium botulinum C/D str. It1]KEH94865.1 (Fe-S)-binding protein [Clostridium novyi A str. GD211209]